MKIYDKLTTSGVTKDELVRLLRKAQAERDRFQLEAMNAESEATKLRLQLSALR